MAAITTAVAVSAGASAYNAKQQRKAAKRAGQAQVSGLESGLQGLTEQYERSTDRLQPFSDAERQALEMQSGLLGLGGPDQQRQAFDDYIMSPGQKFLRDEGEQAILRNASAIGGLGGGRVRQALQRQGIGFAAQNLQNRLQNLRGIGAGATSELGNIDRELGANLANIRSGIGGAKAGVIRDRSAATTGLLGNVAQGAGFLYGRKR